MATAAERLAELTAGLEFEDIPQRTDDITCASRARRK